MGGAHYLKHHSVQAPVFPDNRMTTISKINGIISQTWCLLHLNLVIRHEIKMSTGNIFHNCTQVRTKVSWNEAMNNTGSATILATNLKKKYSQNTPHSLTVRVRFFVGSTSAWYSASVYAMMYTISRYIEPRHNNTCQYFKWSHYWKCHQQKVSKIFTTTQNLKKMEFSSQHSACWLDVRPS